MHQDRASLAELIGSRICHDLISPIGAISNGLELMAMGPAQSDSPEMVLIQQSCDNAAARIRFFRIAFGTARDTRPVAAQEAGHTLADHFIGTRFQAEWAIPDALERGSVQLGYLAALCLETALPRGGSIGIGLSGSDLVCAATGPTIAVDAALWSHLDRSCDATGTALAPAHVQFALLGQLCSDARITPVYRSDEQRLTLTVPIYTPSS